MDGVLIIMTHIFMIPGIITGIIRIHIMAMADTMAMAAMVVLAMEITGMAIIMVIIMGITVIHTTITIITIIVTTIIMGHQEIIIMDPGRHQVQMLETDMPEQKDIQAFENLQMNPL